MSPADAKEFGMIDKILDHPPKYGVKDESSPSEKIVSTNWPSEWENLSIILFKTCYVLCFCIIIVVNLFMNVFLYIFLTSNYVTVRI